MIGSRARRRQSQSNAQSRAIRPRLEGLEDRFLLYATTGTQWAKPKRITYSFVPDGTSIGGVPSNLQATLNARFASADWKLQFARAAAVWQKIANVNFYLVPDSGSPLGATGAQQGDSRFGDIRIGGYAMSGDVLAFAYLAPPANGGTDAGDMFFNTAATWQINGTTYDLMTVAIHEFGHAIGMGHSNLTAAEMYPAYTTTKQAATDDDIAGVRSIYNSRQNDYFDANGANNRVADADSINSYIDGNGQLTLSALDSTTPVAIGQGDLDWYRITVPASTTGRMVVRMQSTDLSLLAPTLAVYNSAGTTKLGEQISYTMGDTVSITISNVSPGQVYAIRCSGTGTGDSGFGAYGLQVNFGSLSQPSVTAPDTYMAEQADRGGGTMSESTESTDVGLSPQDDGAIPGVPTYWVYDDSGVTVSEEHGEVGLTQSDDPEVDAPSADPTLVVDVTAPDDGEIINVGEMSGLGCALMMSGSDHGPFSTAERGTPPWMPRSLSPRLDRPIGAGVTAAQPSLAAASVLDFLTPANPGILQFGMTPSLKNRRPGRSQQAMVDLALDRFDT